MGIMATFVKTVARLIQKMKKEYLLYFFEECFVQRNNDDNNNLSMFSSEILIGDYIFFSLPNQSRSESGQKGSSISVFLFLSIMIIYFLHIIAKKGTKRVKRRENYFLKCLFSLSNTTQSVKNINEKNERIEDWKKTEKMCLKNVMIIFIL